MSTPGESMKKAAEDLDATLESLIHDMSDLRLKHDALAAKHTLLARQVAALEDAEGGNNSGGDTSGGDTSGGGGGGGGEPGTPSESTDLGGNVSHYRFTYGIEPDSSSPTGYTVADKRLVQLYGQYPVVRVMNWTAQTTARKRNTTWDNRITEADFDKWDTPNGSGATGLPIEALIQFANECGSILDWTFPQQCDDDFMYMAGQLFAKLYKQAELVLEGPNEVFDSNRGWHYYKQAGGDFGKAMKLYARDCAEKFEAFVNGYVSGGRSAKDIHRYVGGQLHNLGVLSIHILPHLNEQVEYDGFVVSGYFGDSKDNPGEYINHGGGYNDTIKSLDAHKALADSLGVGMGLYEFNSSINWGQDDYSVIDSPDVQAKLLFITEKCRALKVWPMCVYSLVGYRYCQGDPDANFPIYNPETYMPQSPVVETLELPTI